MNAHGIPAAARPFNRHTRLVFVLVLVPLSGQSTAATAAATNSHSNSSIKLSNHGSPLTGDSGSTGSGNAGNDSGNHSAFLLAADHLPLQLTTAKVDQDFEIDIQLLTNGYDGTTVSEVLNKRGTVEEGGILYLHSNGNQKKTI
ncbi:dopamine receptor 1-like [Drosophila innubila]|uniref:dopamine receptor 1-like n=1 Tax=Drosophila innubila TaxID=198719 RepID=UPI00148C3161|nr:dopamine receptor 1-like [Drosophila innubila]